MNKFQPDGRGGMELVPQGSYVSIEDHEEEVERLNRAIDAAYELADALYNRGYRDARKEKDKDPRAVEEWQDVIDAIQRSGKYAGGA